MSTPNDRIIEILAEGVEAQWASGDLTKSEYADAKDFLGTVEASIDDMRPEDGEDEYTPEAARRMARLMENF